MVLGTFGLGCGQRDRRGMVLRCFGCFGMFNLLGCLLLQLFFLAMMESSLRCLRGAAFAGPKGRFPWVMMRMCSFMKFLRFVLVLFVFSSCFFTFSAFCFQFCLLFCLFSFGPFGASFALSKDEQPTQTQLR